MVAPPKLGRWMYEPKYNGWRVVVHTPTSTVWQREGKLLSIADDFKPALDKLKQTSPFEWLDCEALERRHNIGRGSLFVLDVMDESIASLPYQARVDMMALATPWQCHSFNLPTENNTVYLTPSYTQLDAKTMWDYLKDANARWECEFYEGVVAKRADSPYPIQLAGPGMETNDWVKHRWSW